MHSLAVQFTEIAPLLQVLLLLIEALLLRPRWLRPSLARETQ